MENNEVYLVDTSYSDVYKPFLTEGDISVYLPIASETGHGVVRPGENIDILNGVITVGKDLLDDIGKLKVDRFDCSALPEDVTFNKDGYKEPNSIYYNYVHNVIESNGEVYEVNGQLLVSFNEESQTELLISNGRIYIRHITFTNDNPDEDSFDFKALGEGAVGPSNNITIEISEGF